MKQVICEICGKTITVNNITKHYLSHQQNPDYQNKLNTRQSITHDGLNCKYCNKLCKNTNSLAQHECRCKLNPNKLDLTYLITKSLFVPGRIPWNKGLTKETDARVKQYSDSIANNYKEGKTKVWSEGKTLSDETKAKISRSCSEKAKRGEWHKSLAKNMHYSYNGIDLDGSWELSYAKYLDEHKINWQRCKDRFKYSFEGKIHYYTPDFYLVDTNEYVEVKGYKTKKDTAKWEQFPKDKILIILDKKALLSLGIKINI